MTRRKKHPVPSAPPSAAAPDGTGGAKRKPFDLFLDRGLHALYDEVLNEPIPPELRRLIEDDRTK